MPTEFAREAIKRSTDLVRQNAAPQVGVSARSRQESLARSAAFKPEKRQRANANSDARYLPAQDAEFGAERHRKARRHDRLQGRRVARRTRGARNLARVPRQPS